MTDFARSARSGPPSRISRLAEVRGPRLVILISAIGFGLFLAAIAIAITIPLVITYVETGLVPRFPTAILATGLMIVAFLSFVCGLILDTVVRGRREVRRLHYLSFPAVGED